MNCNGVVRFVKLLLQDLRLDFKEAHVLAFFRMRQGQAALALRLLLRTGLKVLFELVEGHLDAAALVRANLDILVAGENVFGVVLFIQILVATLNWTFELDILQDSLRHARDWGKAMIHQLSAVGTPFGWLSRARWSGQLVMALLADDLLALDALHAIAANEGEVNNALEIIAELANEVLGARLRHDLVMHELLAHLDGSPLEDLSVLV